ncbi:nicotinate-nucleotide--dimethylbenzimidazole phosphoribosyltransferase [Streptococcus pneumoniae]
METVEQIIERLQPLSREKIAEGKAFCDQLAKPLGALGKMETIYARLYAMFEGKIDLAKKVVMVYVADNGIVAEGISSNPQETTFIVAQNILKGKTGLCAISQHVGSSVHLVDIGCKKDLGEHSQDKIRHGTRNMLYEPALIKEEGREAILLGYKQTVELIKKGYTLFGTGEMGIGNTTTSAAVIAAILGLKASQVTGYGAGLTQDMKAHKTAVIEQCLKRHAPYRDVFDMATKLGGLDLLGMVGTYLACAEYQFPCVIDGLISIAALLIAARLAPVVLDYCFPSHISTEPGYALVCEELGLEPMLAMDMRLGEGSGCPLAFFLMENACYTIEHMPTFAEGQLDKKDYIDIRNTE